MHYEARQLSETRVQQRIAHRLRALVLAHRAKLEHAYLAADCAASGGTAKGVLPVQQWAEITQQVLRRTIDQGQRSRGLTLHSTSYRPLASTLLALLELLTPPTLQPLTPSLSRRQVLGIAAPLMQLPEQLLGGEAATASSAGVDYRSYLSRHQLLNPRLEPLYRIHEFLLALMCRSRSLKPSPPRRREPPCPPEPPLSSAGSGLRLQRRRARHTASARVHSVHSGSRLCTFLPRSRARRYRAEQGVARPAEGAGAGARPEEGVLPMRTVECICQIMAKHFGEEAALCAGAATLMGVLGTLGTEFTAAGEVSIARLAEQFALVPQPGDERPGLLSLLHRLNRHYIQALGEGASTVGNADEFPRSSSC